MLVNWISKQPGCTDCMRAGKSGGATVAYEGRTGDTRKKEERWADPTLSRSQEAGRSTI